MKFFKNLFGTTTTETVTEEVTPSLGAEHDARVQEILAANAATMKTMETSYKSDTALLRTNMEVVLERMQERHEDALRQMRADAQKVIDRMS